MSPKRLAIVAIVIAVSAGIGYAISPYFTESTINEPKPQISDMPSESPIMTDESISYTGTFVGVDDGIHDAGGDVYTIPQNNGNSILRLENFYSTNGPGLRVYLATDEMASDYHSLGDLKANRGNQNYEIPKEIDLEKYDHVLIWCEPFSVLFGSAQLSR